MAEGQEDVEQFLYDLERELAHLDGGERQELVKEAEDRLHEIATAIAEHEDAERVRWFHYVQATAEIGPPERLAAELTGEPLPERETRHRQLWAAAGVLVLGVVALLAFAWFTTGDVQPIDEWSGQGEDLTERRQLAFNVSPEADRVFLSLSFAPTQGNASARLTVLDGDANLVYEAEASSANPLQDAEFLEGNPGTWRVIVDFDEYWGPWSVEASQEIG
jgi:hypothetical protein